MGRKPQHASHVRGKPHQSHRVSHQTDESHEDGPARSAPRETGDHASQQHSHDPQRGASIPLRGAQSEQDRESQEHHRQAEVTVSPEDCQITDQNADRDREQFDSSNGWKPGL